MGHISKLPNDIMQRIIALLTIKTKKYGFLSTHSGAARAVYNDQLEHDEIWDMIIDKNWLKKMKAKGANIALVGANLPRILALAENSADQGVDDLIIALTLTWPSGTGAYEDVRPEYTPRKPAERRLFLESNKELREKWRADRERINNELTRDLLSALRCEEGSFDRHMNEVQFPGFKLHIGSVISRFEFNNVERLLDRDEDLTLTLIYSGGPVPIRKVPVRLEEYGNSRSFLFKPVEQNILFWSPEDMEWQAKGQRSDDEFLTN